MFDAADPALREDLASTAYYRDRSTDVAVDAEHAVDASYTYLCLSWESLSVDTQRPYRTGVEVACDALLRDRAHDEA